MPTFVQRVNTGFSTNSKSSRGSNESYDSHSTAPTTIYSGSPRPSMHHAAADRPVYGKPTFGSNSYDEGLSPAATYYPRSSTETYASTTASQEDLFEEPEEYDLEYQVPEYKEVAETDLRTSTPQDFADFFPSTNRLFIRHDDTSYDGNMNLRVDTEVGSGRKRSNVQLFHMRMHNLKAREFSLRRYYRDSGREVCHSSRRYAKPAAERRPGLQRSVSNAIATFRGKPDIKRTNSGNSTHSMKSAKGAKRQDSGYGSNEDDDEFDEDVVSFMSEKKSKRVSIPIPTNTTKLEFSNYAQVDVKRRGAKSSKRYEFEYWGYTYAWKCRTERDIAGKTVSYHLIKGDNGPAVAHIVPELRSPSQMHAEEVAGGWVPPCSMWISDKSVLEALTDVADVIIATGLITLIDDCIKRHWHTKSKRTRQIGVPMTPLKMDMEYVGPKALVEHMFKRRNSGGSTKERDQQRGSPLRFASPVKAY